VDSRIKAAYPDVFEHRIARKLDKVEAWVSKDDDDDMEAFEHPQRPSSMINVAGLIPGQRATFEGRVNEVEDINKGKQTRREVVVGDNSGEITVAFRPGRGGADVQPGQLLRITGKPRQSGTRPLSMVDPTYEVVEEPQECAQEGGESEDGDSGDSADSADS
jgi:RecG-like helicase